ncbi:MAG: DUF4861 family protein [Balneolaceae bacterium]
MLKLMAGISGICFILMIHPLSCTAQNESSYGWYTEGEDNRPAERIRFSVTNQLDISLENQPVVIIRDQLPVQNISQRSVNIVDPNLPPRSAPTVEELETSGGYLYREETNGRAIYPQLDDLDKDGMWDELFYLTDLEPGETRDFYLYIGFYERGIQPHLVHGAIADYRRHDVPFWESETMGWKLWYPHDVDLHAKIDPVLTAYYEYSTGNSGYYMPWELGTDIMTVADTFGAGGICLFEDPDDPENPSRAYHSPVKDSGPFHDTRFSFDVVYNGPLRSMIQVNTMNWDSGRGFYELEQRYTAVAHKSWSTVEVNFTRFLPPNDRVQFGAGIRRIGTNESEETEAVTGNGFVISMGENIEARIPDEDIGDEVLVVPWQAIALVVKEEYEPEYVAIENWGGNHLFKMPATRDLEYEYMIAGAWSFGEINSTKEEFIRYIEDEALKYNNPPVVEIHEYEAKGE